MGDNLVSSLLPTIFCLVPPIYSFLKTLQTYSGLVKYGKSSDNLIFVSFSETKIQADTALHSLSQSMAKVNMMEMNKEEEEEEEIYQSTKF